MRFTLPVLLYGIAAFAAAQTRVTSVGIAGIRDESGSSAPVQILHKITDALQQDLNSAHKDRLLARALDAESGSTVEQLAALGRQNGVAFVVRGGLLALAGGNVQLYVDVISVENGGVTTLRAEGESSDVESALTTAIQRLSASIRNVVAPAEPGPLPAAVPPGDPAMVPPGYDPSALIEAADAEEELWQLVAQADALLAGPSGVSTDALETVRQALEALNDALQVKASIAADGKDPSEADRLVALRRQDLQSALAAATEQSGAAQELPTPSEEPNPGKKGLLASLGEALVEATGILQQIQKIRSAWNGAVDDQSAETSAATGDQELQEEPFEEVNGAVTEDGEPVEGVTVTEPESGETATTDANGSYVLRVVPGKPSQLVLTRNGRRLSTGHVQVTRGRPAVADFELKPHGPSSSRRTLRILPPTVVVGPGTTRSGSRGRLEGVVRDARGRPVPRALVSLRGVAVARTDSQGRYAFIGVPSGAHQMTVYRPGLKAQSSQVQILARRTSQSGIQLAASDPPVLQQRPALRAQGTGTLLRGVVVGNGRLPLTGAKVTLLRRAGAISVLTGANGSYAVRDVEPGEYRAVVTKFGYETRSDNLELRPGKTETRDFTLEKSTSPLAGTPVPATRARPAGTRSEPVAEPKRPGAGASEATATNAPRRPAPGALRGQVVDAQTGKPLAGAVVSIPDARGGETNQAGSFAVGNVRPGAYQVVVRRSGYADGRANVTIRAGETATLTIRLTPRPAMRRR